MRLASYVSLLPIVLAGACSLNADSQFRTVPAGCPAISLRPNLDGGQVLPSSSKPPRRSVTVTLGGSGDEAVIAADITLLGVESPAGTYPLVAAAKPMRIPFHVVQPAGTSGPLVVELALPAAMTSINGATVDAVTFRSGQTWKAAEQNACTARVGTGLLARLP
jgi:hypothetical protein